MRDLLSGSTVLVIDDSEDNRYIISRWLRRTGCVVMTAENGLDGLDQASSRPDAIVVDVRLPDISGLEVVRRLKDDPATDTIPVLIRSATAVSDAERIEGLDAGAEAYLIEPISEGMLLSSLTALLRFSATQQQLEDALSADVTGLFDIVVSTGQATWSDSLERIHRIPAGSFGGTVDDWFDLVHPDDRGRAKDGYSAIRRAGPFSFDGRILRGDGTTGWVEMRGAVFAGPDGRAARIRGVVVDLTDRELAREASERLRSVAEETADRLRTALLPPLDLEVDGWSIDVFRAPASDREQVGGDFDDVVVVDDAMVVMIGDVAGHGLGAASQMATVRSMIRTLVATIGTDPGAILGVANDAFASVCGAGSPFATVGLATIDLVDASARLATAGHPPPVHHDGERAALVELVPGPPLGVVPDAVYEVTRTPLGLGDWLAWYTDGVFERRDEAISDTIERSLALLGPDEDARSFVDAAAQSRSATAATDDDQAVILVRRVVATD